MLKEEFATMLNGRDSANIPFLDEVLSKLAKENGLVVVYGASDDLMEMEGAVESEGDCYDGGVLLVDKEGVLPDFDQVQDEDEMVPYLERTRHAKKIHALFCTEGEFGWAYKTRIPHTTFIMTDLNNDDMNACRGMVFSIQDL